MPHPSPPPSSSLLLLTRYALLAPCRPSFPPLHVGAREIFTYGTPAGSGALFQSKLYHSSRVPSDEVEHLKCTLFWRRDLKDAGKVQLEQAREAKKIANRERWEQAVGYRDVPRVSGGKRKSQDGAAGAAQARRPFITICSLSRTCHEDRVIRSMSSPHCHPQLVATFSPSPSPHDCPPQSCGSITRYPITAASTAKARAHQGRARPIGTSRRKQSRARPCLWRQRRRLGRKPRLVNRRTGNSNAPCQNPLSTRPLRALHAPSTRPPCARLAPCTRPPRPLPTRPPRALFPNTDGAECRGESAFSSSPSHHHHNLIINTSSSPTRHHHLLITTSIFLPRHHHLLVTNLTNLNPNSP